jgi:protein-L-isoaspartate(D-aspartate) O-methyltransferase
MYHAGFSSGNSGVDASVLLCGDWLQCRAVPGSGPRSADWIWSGRVTRAKPMTDSKLQRLNMVESQVRPSDVTDRRIIKAMLEVPREKFVPTSLASMAYMDEPLPVGTANGAGARYLLAPRTFAKLVQLADVGPEATVLDVGCATGYSTAVLARLAKRVIAVESDQELAERARRLLEEVGAGNAVVVHGRLAAGAPADAPYDVILLNGAAETVAPALLEQLGDGGRLAAIVAQGPLCRAQVWRRIGKTFDARPAFEAGAAVLPGFERPAEFVF